MNITGQKVRHSVFGIGTVIEHDGSYITVEFAIKTSKFEFPAAFEIYLKAEDSGLQAQLDDEFAKAKKKEAESLAVVEAARKEEVESRKAAKLSTSRVRKKSIDEMFAADYHIEHLARHPILTYQEVEQQFGIKISGFGRGINQTPSELILISSMSKSAGKFVYHDKWSEDGDYLYSGEGKTGNQSMTKGNLAIKNAASDGKKIFLFVKLSPQEYYYQGVFELVNYQYEDEKGETGDTRKEYKFRLRKVI